MTGASETEAKVNRGGYRAHRVGARRPGTRPATSLRACPQEKLRVCDWRVNAAVDLYYSEDARNQRGGAPRKADGSTTLVSPQAGAVRRAWGSVNPPDRIGPFLSAV